MGGAHGNRNPLHNQIDGHRVKYATSGDRREQWEPCETRSVSHEEECHLYSYIRVRRICAVTSLAAFANLLKATVSFVMSVCMSGRPSAWNTLAPNGRIFMKFCI